MNALSAAGWGRTGRRGRRGPRRSGRAVVTAGLAGVLTLGSWAGQASGSTVAADDGSTGGQAVVGGDVTVSGSGFGHGVGMSQFGALGMAQAGASARSILTHCLRRPRPGEPRTSRHWATSQSVPWPPSATSAVPLPHQTRYQIRRRALRATHETDN